MKRTLVSGAVAAALLVGAAVAVADDFEGGKNVTAVSATFSAATPSRVTTKTCTMSNGQSIVVTDGTFTGTSTSGQAELNGNATVRAHSTINTTTNVGVVDGTLRIDVASGRGTMAQFTGVFSGGQVAGLAVGHAGSGKLVANVSGNFGASTGFAANSHIGGTSGGSAVELLPAGCNKAKTVANKSEAHGEVTANGSGTITVAGLTCTVPASLQAKVATIALHSQAEIHCQLLNGVNTLTSVGKKGGD